jgi:hypothetical protein
VHFGIAWVSLRHRYGIAKIDPFFLQKQAGALSFACKTVPFLFPSFACPFSSLPFLFLRLFVPFSFRFLFFCFSFPSLFLSFSSPFPILSFPFPFPFLFLSLSYSLLSLPLLFLFPFLAHVNSLIKV